MNPLILPENAGYRLRAIARNLVMNEIAKNNRRQRLLDENITTVLLANEDTGPKAGELTDCLIRYESLHPCLAQLSERNSLVVQEGNASVRAGDWKLLGQGNVSGKGPVEKKWELYNIKSEGTELKNFAKKTPAKSRRTLADLRGVGRKSQRIPQTRP